MEKIWERMGKYGKRLRYIIAGRTPACRGVVKRSRMCRAIELGRFGKVWEVLGSGQSPLQPVDAPLRRAIRWVMPPLATRTLSHQLAAMHPKTPNTSQTFPILPTKAAINRIARLPRRSVTKPGVCGVQRHPPTPEAAEDKPAATQTTAGKQYCEERSRFARRIREGAYLCM